MKTINFHKNTGFTFHNGFYADKIAKIWIFNLQVPKHRQHIYDFTCWCLGVEHFSWQMSWRAFTPCFHLYGLIKMWAVHTACIILLRHSSLVYMFADFFPRSKVKHESRNVIQLIWISKATRHHKMYFWGYKLLNPSADQGSFQWC